MKTKVLLLSVAAVIVSFAGGFLLANALNRNEIGTLKAENERLKNTASESSDIAAAQNNNTETTLSGEEIRRKIKEADQNPDNFSFQKNLGIALYRYATIKQDTNSLADVARLLGRANKLNEKDYDVLVALGNLNFDLGYLNKNNQKFEEAREYYQKALEQKPNDSDVRTDLGLTYYLMNPPETDKAVVELQKSLQSNSKNEKALQYLTQAALSRNKTKEAEKYIELLKAVNPNNEVLPQLTAKLEEIRQNSEKQ